MLRKQSLARALLDATARPALVCAVAAIALSAGLPCATAADDLLHALSPVTDAVLAKLAAEDWLMRRGNSWGFSTLDQINTGNVGDLRLSWA